MKLIVILISLTLQVSAAASQQISLSFKNSPLREVMQAIRKQTGYSYMVSTENLKLAKPVTINLKSASIEETLQAIFADQPITYKVEGKVIMIRERVVEKKMVKTPAQQQKDIIGIVKDENGNPLPGATVILKEQNNRGTVTDANGRFSFPNAPDKGTILFRMIGRETKEIRYLNDNLVNITLREVFSDMNEVQVIAYGTVSKKFITSNIGTVSAEEIQRQPVSNPILALSGRVPGLLITQRSGVTASATNVNVQGVNSLLNSNAPFYVVDGVPYPSEFTTNSLSNGASNTFGGNTFNFINPSDIESITILKDADATAIYGSRAANGAILITTKKGTPGKTNVNVNLQNGWGKITRMFDLVNAEEYLQIRKEGYINDGLPIPTTASDPEYSNYDLTSYDQKKNTDWQKELIGGTAKFTDLQGSISGGSQQTQFMASYGYHNETTVYPANFYDRRGNVRFNLSHSSADNKFKYVLTSSYVQGENTLGGGDMTIDVTMLAPNFPDLRLPDGSLNWGYLPDGTQTIYAQPLMKIVQRYNGNTSNLIADNSISYKILNGLELKGNFGYNKLQADETLFAPLAYFSPTDPSKNRTSGFINKSIATWIAEPQLTYNKSTDFGTFDFLLGTTFQQTKTDLLDQKGEGYTTDAQLPDLSAAPTKSVNSVIHDLYKYTALFSRLNYRLFDRFIVNLSLRRDGSSRFGAENKFHTFYAIGGAWLFGDEFLIKNRLPFLSFGKLRGSYGTTGNDQISNYRYLSLLNTFTGAQMPYQDGQSLVPSRIANPFIQWEETRKLNVGLDLGFFDSRISLTLNYARNKSTNQLVNEPLPRITGAAGVDANLPALVRNTSYEAQLNVIALKSKKLNWNLSGNITIPKNKLVTFPNLEKTNYKTTFVVGQSTNLFRAFQFEGVNPETGLYQFRTAKGELSSSPSEVDDRFVYINLNPKFYGGFSNTLSYKGFQLDFLLQFVKQDAPNGKFGTGPGLINEIPLRSILGRWQKPGDISNIQKISTQSDAFTALGAANNSTERYSDASYIRLKNASLSYSLPQVLISRANMSAARIYIQGQNLLTLTNYYGADPETIQVGMLPPLRVFTLGLQVTF